jgi:hypothetical protein
MCVYVCYCVLGGFYCARERKAGAALSLSGLQQLDIRWVKSQQLRESLPTNGVQAIVGFYKQRFL